MLYVPYINSCRVYIAHASHINIMHINILLVWQLVGYNSSKEFYISYYIQSSVETSFEVICQFEIELLSYIAIDYSNSFVTFQSFQFTHAVNVSVAQSPKYVWCIL